MGRGGRLTIQKGGRPVQEPNDLLRHARLRLVSPSGSGRALSRQELAEAVNAWLFEHTDRVSCLDASHIGKLERGVIRWPQEDTRQALCAVLGAANDADLGFCIVREPVDMSDPAPVTGPRTLLRTLVAERRWRPLKAFRSQFLKAARELAEREGDPEFGRLDVSERQFCRWLDGARPCPYSCRVLERLFGLPIDELMRPTDAVAGGGNGGAGTEFAAQLKDLRVGRGLSLRRLGRLVHYSHGYLWDLETGGKQPTPEVASALDRAFGAGGALSALVAARTATAETTHAVPETPAPSGAVAAVTLTVTASPTGAVRVVIDTGPGHGSGLDAFAEPSGGGARVYSLAQARAARVVRLGSA